MIVTSRIPHTGPTFVRKNLHTGKENALPNPRVLNDSHKNPWTGPSQMFYNCGQPGPEK